jgi:3-oxoacyl-[acyl-carrier-protein] synthase-1
MESKAIGLSQLAAIPVNSFKGYWGHTLGAAGIIESVAAIRSLRGDFLIRSAGFESLGVTTPVKVIDRNFATKLTACLKTASGFGGCNAAAVYQKL